jgi:hypothetical protein
MAPHGLAVVSPLSGPAVHPHPHPLPSAADAAAAMAAAAAAGPKTGLCVPLVCRCVQVEPQPQQQGRGSSGEAIAGAAPGHPSTGGGGGGGGGGTASGTAAQRALSGRRHHVVAVVQLLYKLHTPVDANGQHGHGGSFDDDDLHLMSGLCQDVADALACVAQPQMLQQLLTQLSHEAVVHRRRQRKPQAASSDVCYHCKQRGHWKQDCPQLHPDKVKAAAAARSPPSQASSSDSSLVAGLSPRSSAAGGLISGERINTLRTLTSELAGFRYAACTIHVGGLSGRLCEGPEEGEGGGEGPPEEGGELARLFAPFGRVVQASVRVRRGVIKHGRCGVRCVVLGGRFD